MFLPPHFTDDDPRLAVEFCRSSGFGHLVVSGPDGPASTPLPFMISDDGSSIRGHLARPNPLWELAPCSALLIVPVADAYVSPSWYPSKAEHGKVVPTWNYEIVHLHGELVAHDDPSWLEPLLRELTDHHESRRPEPWSVDDAPPHYVDTLTRAIVGVELIVRRTVVKRKLSQNKDGEERGGVIAGLDAEADDGAARIRSAMRDVARP